MVFFVASISHEMVVMRSWGYESHVTYVQTKGFAQLQVIPKMCWLKYIWSWSMWIDTPNISKTCRTPLVTVRQDQWRRGSKQWTQPWKLRHLRNRQRILSSSGRGWDFGGWDMCSFYRQLTIINIIICICIPILHVTVIRQVLTRCRQCSHLCGLLPLSAAEYRQYSKKQQQQHHADASTWDKHFEAISSIEFLWFLSSILVASIMLLDSQKPAMVADFGMIPPSAMTYSDVARGSVEDLVLSKNGVPQKNMIYHHFFYQSMAIN